MTITDAIIFVAGILVGMFFMLPSHRAKKGIRIIMSIQLHAGEEVSVKFRGKDAAGNSFDLPAGPTFAPTILDITGAEVGTFVQDPNDPASGKIVAGTVGTVGEIKALVTLPDSTVLSDLDDDTADEFATVAGPAVGYTVEFGTPGPAA